MEKWPEVLVVPSEDAFAYGCWVQYSPPPDHEESKGLWVAARKMSLHGVSAPTREELRFSCGTQCCLVGWVALAMDEESASPHRLRNLATAKFLNHFVKLAGYPSARKKKGECESKFIERVACRASDVFEGENSCGSELFPILEGKLTPARARELYIETAKHFGYDVENLYE